MAPKNTLWSLIDDDLISHIYEFVYFKGYKFPFGIVIYHLIVKFVLASLMRQCYRIFTGKERVKVPCQSVVRKIAPTSFFGAIDIGFSQWGLEYVHVALYTMTKSSVIIFITFFAILFKLERKVSLFAINLNCSNIQYLFHDFRAFHYCSSL